MTVSRDSCDADSSLIEEKFFFLGNVLDHLGFLLSSRCF